MMKRGQAEACPDLLSDYALLLHPEQSARLKDNLPACTVGSLKQISQMEALVDVIRGVVDADDPHKKLEEIIAVVPKLFPPRDSAKHSGRDLGKLEPTLSLKLLGTRFYGLTKNLTFVKN